MRLVITAIVASFLVSCTSEKSVSETEAKLIAACEAENQKAALCKCVAGQMAENFSPDMLESILAVLVQGSDKVDENEWINSLAADEQAEYFRVGGLIEAECSKYD